MWIQCQHTSYGAIIWHIIGKRVVKSIRKFSFSFPVDTTLTSKSLVRGMYGKINYFLFAPYFCSIIWVHRYTKVYKTWTRYRAFIIKYNWKLWLLSFIEHTKWNLKCKYDVMKFQMENNRKISKFILETFRIIPICKFSWNLLIKAPTREGGIFMPFHVLPITICCNNSLRGNSFMFN